MSIHVRHSYYIFSEISLYSKWNLNCNGGNHNKILVGSSFNGFLYLKTKKCSLNYCLAFLAGKGLKEAGQNMRCMYDVFSRLLETEQLTYVMEPKQ